MRRRLRRPASFAAGAAVAAVAAVASLLGPATASATDCGIPGAADATFTGVALDVEGDVLPDRTGGFLQIPFTVPAGTTAVRVRYSYDQPGPAAAAPCSLPSNVNTLDMGVYGPRDAGEVVFGADESRGWSGSAVRDLAIAVNGFTSDAVYETARRAFVQGRTTRAYEPGPIPAGEWAVELGLAYIEPSDADGIHYHVRVETSSDPVWSDDPYAPNGPAGASQSPSAGWYAGDLHVHGEQEPGNATVADTLERAFLPPSGGGSGLDFVTLVDHNNAVGHDDLAADAAAHPGKLVIPGVEMTTYEGHFNNQGRAPFVDFRTGAILQPSGSPPYADASLTQVRGRIPPSRAFGEISSYGNWTQINHPSIFRGAPSFCRGCAWSYSDADTDFSRVDAIEVQTGPAGLPFANPVAANPFTPEAIAFYEHALDTGAHVAAVGASDDHQGGTDGGPTASPVGSATTMVFASELSEQAIADGVKGDHTYVKLFGNDGPEISLTAAVPGRPDAIIGDSTSGPRAQLTAVVSGVAAIGRPGSWKLSLLRNGDPVEEVPFTGDGVTHSFGDSGSGRYSLAVTRTNLGIDYPEVYSSPIWFTSEAGAKPSSSFTIGKVRRNKRRGTARLSVTVPGAGTVTLAGRGLGAVERRSGGPATLELPVKPKTRALKRKLKRTGAVKVRARVGFHPEGGDPATQDRRLKLQRQRSRR